MGLAATGPRALLAAMKRRHPLVTLLLRWGTNALGIMVAERVVPGIEYENNTALLIVVVVLGLFNAFLKPLLVLFALPFVVLTLGFGILIINAALFLLAAHFVDGFKVDGFLAAFFAALIVSVFNLLLGRLLGDPPMPRRGRKNPPNRRDIGPGGGGDVIDI